MIPKWLRQWRQQAYSVKKHRNQHPERRFQLWLEELETRTLPSFALAPTVSAGAFASGVAVADFNGDGTPDLAVTTYYNNVKVFFGNGNGTFQAPQTLTAGNFTYGLAVADVDGDGTPDLIVSNFRGNTISIFLAFNNGTFSTALNFSVGSGPEGIAVGDFNGD